MLNPSKPFERKHFQTLFTERSTLQNLLKGNIVKHYLQNAQPFKTFRKEALAICIAVSETAIRLECQAAMVMMASKYANVYLVKILIPAHTTKLSAHTQCCHTHKHKREELTSNLSIPRLGNALVEEWLEHRDLREDKVPEKHPS